MTEFRQCGSRMPTQVFSHYAFGAPSPFWARFIGEGDEAVAREDGITIYVRCEREDGHEGKHLARDTRGWIYA